MNAPLYLVTGAGGGTGGVSRQVVEGLRGIGKRVRALVHHDDARADPLREIGAEVVVGDLTEPRDVVDAMAGADRIFFSMSVSPDYLKASEADASDAIVPNCTRRQTGPRQVIGLANARPNFPTR